MVRLRGSKLAIALLCLVLLGAVAWADLVTSPSLEFRLFYLIPLLLGAWYVGEAFAFTLCGLSASMAYADAAYNGLPVDAYVHANAATRLLAFAIVVCAVLALRQVNHRLQISEALRGNLTSMVVHDLKSPLASASMAVTMLRRSLREGAEHSPSPEQQEELLRIVGQSQEELGDLIDELLITARGESGTAIPLSPAPADLTEVLREVVRATRLRAQESGISLAERYPSGAVTLALDVRLIRRVIENLLDNALKFTPRGGKVEVTAEAEGEGARVTVRDTGPRVAGHLQEHVFDRFAQAAAAGQGERVSIGLGLTFCRLVVEAHGGAIWVESVPGEGAAFIFTLPAEPPQPKAAHNH
jgi:signal transduction histidine kinase